jgi:hypothetical protein
MEGLFKILVFFMRDGEEEIGVFAVLRVMCEEFGEVRYGLVVVLEVESADAQQVLRFEIVGVAVGALCEDGESLLELVVLHQFLALRDGLAGSWLPALLPALLQDGVVGCRLVEVAELVLDVASVAEVVDVGDGAVCVGEPVLLCLKGEFFLRVGLGWGTRRSDWRCGLAVGRGFRSALESFFLDSG